LIDRENAVKKRFDAVTKYIRESDMFLFSLCIASAIYGIVLIYSATRSFHSNTSLYIQIISLILGVGLYILFSLLDVDTIADKAKILYVLSILFISTLFIWGTEVNGNKAWLDFGAIRLQPAEVVKIPFIIIMAKMISTFKDKKTLNTLVPLVQVLAVFGGLFVFIMLSSGDLGSALVYIFILFMMLYIGGVELRWMLLGLVLFAAATFLAWHFFLSDLQKARIIAPYDPSVDPTRRNVLWQSDQSRYAIAAGDFLGTGLLKGKMTQGGSVPKQYTDFIFSAAGEELGFVGCFAIVLLLALIIIRCIVVGIRSNNTVGMLVCVGMASMLIAQTFENIGMCLGLTPVIGLTLPFFSYGGTSLVTMFAAMGVVSGIKMRPKPSRFRS
jgi:rod shape determining protein RodA